jgi:predicted transposase/invertase (TIGR01784 family)
MERMPFKARKAVFDRLEQIASKANMSVEERNQYETEWKIYNDYFNTIDSAKREGRAEGHAEGRAEGRAEGMKEGRAEGMKETARNLKRIGVQTEIIMHATGLSAEEIDAL